MLGDNILGPGNIIGVLDGIAGGDLEGNFPVPKVKSIQGVAISGTPGAGWKLISTGASAASWVKNLQPVTIVTTAATLLPNAFTPIETTTGSLVMQLPSAQQQGTLCAVQKYDSTIYAVQVSGSIEAESKTFELLYPKEAILFVADSNGSWWPLANYRSLAGLDARYVGVQRTIHEITASGTETTIPDVSVATATKIVLTNNCALTFPMIHAGKQFILDLTQDNIGSRTVTWPTEVKWPEGNVPTLTTAAGAVDLFSFICIDGIHWLGSTLGLNMH